MRLVKGNRHVDVADTDTQKLAYYAGEGWRAAGRWPPTVDRLTREGVGEAVAAEVVDGLAAPPAAKTPARAARKRAARSKRSTPKPAAKPDGRE